MNHWTQLTLTRREAALREFTAVSHPRAGLPTAPAPHVPRPVELHGGRIADLPSWQRG